MTTAEPPWCGTRSEYFSMYGPVPIFARFVDHRVKRRDAGDFRMPGGPDPFDPDEADPMDVDHVDPHLLDQVRLPAREHRESVARIVAELLRPDVDGPGLPPPAAARVFRREDDDLVAVGLELPAGRQDRRHDAVDGGQVAIREECDPHGIHPRAKTPQAR